MSETDTTECDTCGRTFDTERGLHIHESMHAEVSGCQMHIGDGSTCPKRPSHELTFRRPDGSGHTKRYCDEHAELAGRSDALVDRRVL